MSSIGKRFDVLRYSLPPGSILTKHADTSDLSNNENTHSDWRIPRYVAELIIVIGSFGYLGIVPGLIATTISLTEIGLYFHKELK